MLDRQRCGRLAVAKFSSQVPEGSTLISGDTQISSEHSAELLEESLHAKNQLDSSSYFNIIPACDRRKHDGNTYRASIASCGRNAALCE